MSPFGHLHTITEFETAAGRILPKHLYDYVVSGSFSELTLRESVSAFDKYAFRQNCLVDVSEIRLGARFLGQEHSLPFLLAPAALSGALWPNGEVLAARAAHAAGIPYCLSTVSVCSLEAVRNQAAGPLAFQLYVTRDRELNEQLIDRARRAGYSSLFVTVDVPILAKREKDARNGSGAAYSPRALRNMISRPRWLIRTLKNGVPQLGNFQEFFAGRGDLTGQAYAISALIDPRLTWPDIAWIRRLWPGRLVLKGILEVDDASRAADAGVDAVVVSNHGGRQLDGAVAAIDALPKIVSAVGDRLEVLFDSGIRRGRHIAIALALGARACLIGRAHVYGLAVGGQAGVARILDLLTDELKTTCALMGVPRSCDLYHADRPMAALRT